MEASGAAAVGDGTRGELDLRRVRERVLAKGFTADQFEQAIDEYSLLDVSITVQCSRRLTVLMLLDRSGKQLEKAQGLSLSRLGWRMRIWIGMLALDVVVSVYGVPRRWISERR